jgi:hypothetical protein
MSTTASTAGTTAIEAVVRATPGSVSSDEPQTPEGVREDVLEESEEEPEMVPEPEVVPEQVPVEGAMIIARAATPSPASSSSFPRIAATAGAASGVRLKAVLGHPSPYAPGNVPLDEAMSTAHRALSQVQRVLRRKGEDLADERRCLQLWANMLKRTTVSERATTWARQHGFDLQLEAIAQRNADSKRALADAQELYASADAVIKLEEDLVVRVCQGNQWAWEVEELEGQLQEREELDDITLRRETSLEHLEGELEQEWKALEDARTQIIAQEIDADSWETGLRDQEARLVTREWQLAEWQMPEPVVTQKGLEDLQASRAGDGQRVWSFLGQADAALASFGFSPVRGGDAAPEADVVLPLLDSARRKISQLEEAIGSRLEEEGRTLA